MIALDPSVSQIVSCCCLRSQKHCVIRCELFFILNIQAIIIALVHHSPFIAPSLKV
jgi:hypothetical protein